MPIPPKPITIDGLDYASQREAAKTYGCSPAALLKHLANAASVGQPLSEYLADKTFCFQMGGVLYTSKAKLARALRIGVNHLFELETSEGGLEAAVVKAKTLTVPPDRIPIVINGVSYPSLKGKGSAKNALGISDTTLKRYLQQSLSTGESLDAIVARYKAPNKPIAHVVKGRTYLSTKSLARTHGLAATRVAARLREGLTGAQAVVAPKKRNRIPLTHAERRVKAFGKTFRSLTAAAAAYGFPEPTINKRLKRGLTLEEALTRPAAVGRPAPCTAAGVSYPSVAKAMAALGLAPRLRTLALLDGTIVLVREGLPGLISGA